jgi:hypothetical protein
VRAELAAAQQLREALDAAGVRLATAGDPLAAAWPSAPTCRRAALRAPRAARRHAARGQAGQVRAAMRSTARRTTWSPRSTTWPGC